jgi:hypothetical protein
MQATHGRKKLALLRAGAFSLLLLALVAACNDEDPTPTSTPTVLPPISVTADSTGGDIFSQLPASEQTCLEEALDTNEFEQLLVAGIYGDVLSFLNAEEVIDCFSNDSVVRLFIGELVSEAGVLSDGTITCIRNTLGSVDLQTVLSRGTTGGQSALGGLTGMLLCLTEEEAERISLRDLLDSDQGDVLTLADVRCLAEHVDLKELEALVSGPDNLEFPESLLTALVECGTFTEGDLGIDFDLPLGLEAKQIMCVADALGPEAMQAITSGSRLTTTAEMQAIFSCGIDLNSPIGQ